MKMLNKIGPDIDHRVTLRITSCHSFKEEPMFTCCLSFGIKMTPAPTAFMEA